MFSLNFQVCEPVISNGNMRNSTVAQLLCVTFSRPKRTLPSDLNCPFEWSDI